MKIATIYKAINKNTGKIYIGFDSKWPRRKYNHETDAYKINHNAYNTIFHNSIRKHGIDSFEWEIVFQSPDLKYTLNHMEEYFIKYYNSHHLDNGYNMSFGGQGSLGRIVSAETRKKLSIKNTGKIWSEDQLETLRKSKRGLAKTQIWKESMSKNMTGVKKSETHIENMHLSNAKFWKIHFPNGHIEIIKGLRKFCKDNKLNRRFITKEKGSIRGCIKSRGYKGYFAELLPVE